MMPNMVTMVSLPMETANKRAIFAGKDGLRWLGLKVDEQMDQATNVNMTKKSERIIETKETEQKRQTQIERGRCDKKIKRLRQNE